jgi:hypothetical protein
VIAAGSTKTIPVAITVLAALVAGCGSEERAATSPPAPTATAADSPEHEAPHGFEPGHTAAVRRYYGEPHEHDGENASIEAKFHQPPKPATGGIGDTIVLTGTNIGVRVRATVTGVSEPAEVERRARPGKRWLAVGLRLRVTGIAILEDQLRQAVVSYAPGGKARVVAGVKASCSNGMDELIRVDVGHRARGCLLFEVPEDARPRELQLALEQVPAEAGGRWSLR